MADSFFSYNVKRNYPFKWFTPVAIVGGVLLLVLFSLMNFISNGYDLVTQTSSDPATTIADSTWFAHWPSYLTEKVQPKCEYTDIDVSSQFSTNNTALSYTLMSVWSGNGTTTVSPTLTYYNNAFQACNVTQINMDFETITRPQNEFEAAFWGIEVRAFATCEIDGPNGLTKVNISALYNALTDYQQPGISTFISQNKTTRASLYWAEALLAGYWSNTTFTLMNITGRFPIGNYLLKGSVIYRPNPSVSDISSLDFFLVNSNFFQMGTGTLFYWGPNTTAVFLRKHWYPNVWFSADRLAKSMYSAVLTDLGQTQTPRESNIVTNATLIQDYSHVYLYRSTIPTWDQFGPVNETYATTQKTDPSGPLGFNQSVIATKYLCQVPQLKTGGNIFISVLLADLVLLQAVWKLFTFLIGLTCLRKRTSANICEGCQEARGDIELTPHSPSEASTGRTGALGERKGFTSLAVRHREPYQRTGSHQRLISDESVQSHAIDHAGIRV